MREYEFLMTLILPYRDRIYDSVLMQENNSLIFYAVTDKTPYSFIFYAVKLHFFSVSCT